MATIMKNIGLSSLIILILSGCAGGPNSADVEMSPERTERLLRAALTDVQDIYINETRLSALVKAGLQNVAKDNPPTEVTETDRAIIVSYNEKEMHRIVWSETDDPQVWGSQTAMALKQLQSALPPDLAPSYGILADSFLAGVAGALDPGSRYVPPSKIRASFQRFRDSVGALNISIARQEGRWQVKGIHNADLRESRVLRIDDAILKVNGVTLSGLRDEDAFALFRGEIGSPITLTIMREGLGEPTQVTVARERGGTKPVGTYPDGRVLRVFAAQFNPPSIEELRMILTKITESGALKYKGFILDLRGHPGGALESSIELAETFLKKGRILSTHGRHPDSHQHFFAGGNDLLSGMPMVVVVDHNTGAGAEVVAAALQNLGRVVVVGSSTFGSGTVQTVLTLPNRGNFSLTWTEMYSSGGYPLENRGVLPTVCTGGEMTADSILAELSSGGGIIDRATRTREIDPEDEEALKAHRALCPPRSDGEDISLEVAKAILKGPGLYDQILARDNGQQSAATQ